MTFVRVGIGLSGHVSFHERKTRDFVHELLRELFNTYTGSVGQFVDPLYDYNNWVQKFEFDHSNRIFHDFFFLYIK